ncbi:lipid A biosynthesis acyltransferase [Acidihalobacter yilgarnensis]|uniref:Lipid A biosynthesis acyltransferase n=1 Tax=Acidihalobacter yilgarnensis TaxID=2819280 RepID=A0A1D8IS00_9GAMM|nr:lipid A biosynthesis acyltransferase [Acidihalobacter yilgarnensis]AOU99281.1 lipid A biosynthesis acyltransferase [Acidihalobacter yilgarnensis]
MSRAWTAQTELSNRWAMGFIRWVALSLGRRVARLALLPITAYYLLRAGESRRQSRAYLSRVLGRPARLTDVARHMHCFAATILDRVFLLSGRDAGLDVRVHGEALLRTQIEHGEGCLLLGAHLGSFEVLRALGVQRHALPIRVLMYPEHNQTLTRMLSALNPAIADTVIPLGGIDTLLRVKECLAAGDLVGLLGDRIAESDKTLPCDFLGGIATFPRGPLLTAAALKAPVLLCFGLYRGGKRYDIHFERLTPALDIPRAQRDAVTTELTRRYAERLEHYTRLAPYNWFNFYDYWQS